MFKKGDILQYKHNKDVKILLIETENILEDILIVKFLEGTMLSSIDEHYMIKKSSVEYDNIYARKEKLKKILKN